MFYLMFKLQYIQFIVLNKDLGNPDPDVNTGLWRNQIFFKNLNVCWCKYVLSKINYIPSNVLSSTYFLGKTFFFSKIFLGDPPLNFLEVCLKFRSLERWSEKIDFHIARSPKKRFSADVELRSIVPNFVMSKNSMMQMCSG